MKLELSPSYRPYPTSQVKEHAEMHTHQITLQTKISVSNFSQIDFWPFFFFFLNCHMDKEEGILEIKSFFFLIKKGQSCC